MMSYEALLILTGVAVAGASLSLLRWVDAVPPSDRRFRDRPPWGVRLLWWPVSWLGHYLDLLPGARLQQRSQALLVGAGLDYALTAGQWNAALLLYALAGAVLGGLAAVGMHAPPGMALVLGALLPVVLARSWLRDRVALRRADTARTLPFFLDLITLCVEAGLNLNAALAQAVERGPQGALRDELQRVLRDMRAGRSRAEALRGLAQRMGSVAITYLVTALVQAEATGMSLGPVLRAQAEQRRAERFALAEKRAMEAPVKMLLPLIGFIFPCTFIVLGFPVAMKFMQIGL